MSRAAARRFWSEDRGFTLPEVLITIALMGIVFTIASSSWQNVTESRRVTSATTQLAADLRLSNSKATNQLSAWRVVLMPGRGAQAAGPDYYLVKTTSGASPTVDTSIQPTQRFLPDNASVVDAASNLNDDSTVRALYTSLPLYSGPSRTLQFNSNGSMKTYSNPAAVNKDVVEVTDDGDPKGRLTFSETTSRIKID